MTIGWPQSIRRQGIALFVPSLQFGGAERSTVDLANAFAREGLPTYLLVCDSNGAYRERVEPSVALTDLQSGRILHSILPLTQFLRSYRPAVLISALDHANIVSLIATKLACVPTKTVVTLRVAISKAHVDSAGRKNQVSPSLMHLMYPRASAVIAVSKGVADDYATTIGIPRKMVQVIYNPVVTEKTIRAAQAPLSHPWFCPGEPPVILSVGRLTAIKDFPNLLHAFALVRRKQRCRLLILGDGELREELEELGRCLELGDDLAMPGFADNPYAYMARAAVYVLSSAVEGLPGALIEAIACGTPVVATDCPSGPREILADGRYGPLVPIRDSTALANAIELVLRHPQDSYMLRERAKEFSEEHALAQYQALLRQLVAKS